MRPNHPFVFLQQQHLLASQVWLTQLGKALHQQLPTHLVAIPAISIYSSSGNSGFTSNFDRAAQGNWGKQIVGKYLKQAVFGAGALLLL